MVKFLWYTASNFPYNLLFTMAINLFIWIFANIFSIPNEYLSFKYKNHCPKTKQKNLIPSFDKWATEILHQCLTRYKRERAAVARYQSQVQMGKKKKKKNSSFYSFLSQTKSFYQASRPFRTLASNAFPIGDDLDHFSKWKWKLSLKSWRQNWIKCLKAIK